MNKKVLLKLILIVSILFNIVLSAYIAFDFYKNRRNRDIFRLNEYAYANAQLETPTFEENRVVFIGNSITENWVHLRYRFFVDNNYVCRGIGGQTSPLLLLRFRQDVIDLKPKIVVINTGINDIAENTGVYDPIFTLDNIKSMAQLAEINGIKVILTSILPCIGYGWKNHIKEIPQKIDSLNSQIRAYADERGYLYVDYNTALRDDQGGIISSYSFDALHPNEEGYKVMEPIIQNAIKELLD